MAMTKPDISNFWLWWDFQDTTTHVDEVQGKELTGSASRIESGHVQKYCLECDQSNSEKVTAADASWNSFGDIELTMGAWFYIASLDDNNWHFMGKRDGTDSTEEYFLMKDAAERIKFGVGSSDAYTGSGTISAGNWYYIEGSHDPVANKIYIKVYNTSGVLHRSSSAAHSGGFPSTSAPYFTIGAGYAYGGFNRHADIYVEQAFIYKGLFTTAEREWMVNGGDGRAYADLIGGNRIITWL